MTHASLQACVLRKQETSQARAEMSFICLSTNSIYSDYLPILDCLQTLEHLYLICTAHLAEDVLVTYYHIIIVS